MSPPKVESAISLLRWSQLIGLFLAANCHRTDPLSNGFRLEKSIRPETQNPHSCLSKHDHHRKVELDVREVRRINQVPTLNQVTMNFVVFRSFGRRT